MSTTEAPTERSARSSPSPGQVFGMVLDAAVGAAAAKLERRAAGWIDKLTDRGLDAVAESGGVVQRAGAEGVKAHVHGRSPAWAAIRSAWQTGTPAVRAAILTSGVAAVVLLLLSPALLLVYLLSWLVIAAVCRAGAARRRHPTAA